jgi:hypothetical protein
LRCPRALARHLCSRAAWASPCRHYDRRARCSLDGDRTARVTPVEKRKVCAPRLGRLSGPNAPAESPEAWPDAEPWGPTSPWREPQWNAGRRARPAGRAPHLASAEVGDIAPAGVLLPLFAGSESKRIWCRVECREARERPASLIVMSPALHCRICLTKIGIAAMAV